MSTVNELIAQAPYKVLYDSNCGICTSSMEVIESLDKTKLTEPIPLSNEAIEELKLTATFKECAEQIHIVDAHGKLYKGYDAIILLGKLFPLTRMVSVIAKAIIPHSLGVALYKFVARNRYKFLKKKCKNGACAIHYED